MIRFSLVCCLGLAGSVCAQPDGGWQREVSGRPAGSFSELPAVRMEFTFGWSNVLKAAEAQATIRPRGNDVRSVVAGKTLGMARALWPLDAQHSSTVTRGTLLPKHLSQFETYRKRTIETRVRFDANGLERFRKVSTDTLPAKWKRVNFTPIRDVIGGVLYVRSQPLKVGDRIGLVCFPGDSPYLVVVTVEGRETIRAMGGEHPALRLSLDVRKLEVEDKKPVQAVSYKKFRSGTVWVSDDALRLPLRAEVNVFIGFVYGELVSYEKL